MKNELFVSEIFYSLQGEGNHFGKPCVFVRMQGCNLRCLWCDTAYAQDSMNLNFISKLEDEKSFPIIIELKDLINIINSYNCKLICITGGEPLAQGGTNHLIKELCDLGYNVLLETNGSILINDVDERAIKIVDFKCPSSQMTEFNNYSNIKYLTLKDEIKFVVENKKDYLWAKELINKYSLDTIVNTITISPVFNQINLKQLAKWILKDNLPVRLQIQLHKIIWGPNKRGV